MTLEAKAGELGSLRKTPPYPRLSFFTIDLLRALATVKRLVENGNSTVGMIVAITVVEPRGLL